MGRAQWLHLPQGTAVDHADLIAVSALRLDTGGNGVIFILVFAGQKPAAVFPVFTSVSQVVQQLREHPGAGKTHLQADAGGLCMQGNDAVRRAAGTLADFSLFQQNDRASAFRHGIGNSGADHTAADNQNVRISLHAPLLPKQWL